MNKRILIIGGDTEALAVNYVLSSFGHDTTVVSPIEHPDRINPYSQGPFRFAGISDALIDALEDLEMPFSEYIVKNGMLQGGEVSKAGKLDSYTAAEFWNKSRTSPEVLGVKPEELFADPEFCAHVKKGIRFDYQSFAAQLTEFASPIYGEVETVNLEDGDLCIRIPQRGKPDEFSCLEFDHVVWTTPRWEWAPLLSLPAPMAERNRIIRASYAGSKFMGFECIYAIDTLAVHRISHVDGFHVCEANEKHELDVIFDDLIGIFGEDEFSIDSMNTHASLGYMSWHSTPELPPRMHELGNYATWQHRDTLADVMTQARELGKKLS